MSRLRAAASHPAMDHHAASSYRRRGLCSREMLAAVFWTQEPPYRESDSRDATTNTSREQSLTALKAGRVDRVHGRTGHLALGLPLKTCAMVAPRIVECAKDRGTRGFLHMDGGQPGLVGALTASDAANAPTFVQTRLARGDGERSHRTCPGGL